MFPSDLLNKIFSFFDLTFLKNIAFWSFKFISIIANVGLDLISFGFMLIYTSGIIEFKIFREAIEFKEKLVW